MRDIQRPGRSVVMGLRGMVATSQPMATATGLEVLRRGGNAMDAAVAAAAVLCVTEPHSTGIGGDCFLLYHEARSGRLHGLNGSGRAPAGAAAADIRARGHDTMPERGMLAVTVPGAVDAWHTALKRFGTLRLDQVLAPAIDYAEEGYAVTEVVARAWKKAEALLAATPDARRALLVDGRAPAAGTRQRQPELAHSLRLIADHGRDAFYEGEIAEKITAFSERNGGLLTLADFRNHRSDWVEPVHTEYRGLRVHEIPPNGQGIAALMMLNILRHAEGTLEHLGPDHVHLVAEAYRLARAERDRFVSDPEYGRIPVEELLSEEFGQRQWRRIDPERALAHPVLSGLASGGDTVYLSAVDEERNAVSFINSLYSSYGSGLVAGDTGITLHNRGSCFVLEEGHLNCIAPGKRPLHTIIPAMVYRGDRPLLCYGVMGGDYQPMGHAWVLSNWVDFGLDLQQAVDAPRFQAEDGLLWVERGVPEATRRELARRGHRIMEREDPLGGAQCIHIDAERGVLAAASDPRKDGCALGY